MSCSPKRYNCSVDFPHYAFVPGFSPHPRNHPEGHSFSKKEEKPLAMNPFNWQDSEMYLYGIDLFNYGYYWEAHEAWESLWHSAGKEGHTADFLKALIKITASAVKIRQGQPHGTKEHAKRAKIIFQNIKNETGLEKYAGLNLSSLIEFSELIFEKADEWVGESEKKIVVLFDQYLIPEE